MSLAVASPLRRSGHAAAVVLLLAAFLLQAVASMRLKSVTFDETTHIASGYAALMTGDLRLNPQHPPLVKLLAALPLLAINPRLDLDDPAWTQSPPDEWAFGRRFLFSNDADRVLFWARLPVVLLGLVLCCYVYAWARELWGPWAGLLSLALTAGCPNLIAHSRLVTMDLALSCFSVISCYHLRRFLASGSYPQLLAAAAGLGAALASKFSAVVLLPVLAALVLLALLRPPAGSPLATENAIVARSRHLVRPVLILGLVTILIVWAAYRFPTSLDFYLKGLQLVNQDHSATYAAYLNGELRVGGWWYYFLAAFLYKTRASVLLLMVAALVLLRRASPRALLDEAFLVLPPLILLLVTSAFAADIGVRYILPVYPFLFIALGRIASIRLQGKRLRLALAVVLAVGAVETAGIYPHHLSYFNALVGGASQGHYLLDDSNIDWGQDLPALAAVMAEHRIDQVMLLSPWLDSTSPEHYGVSCTRAPIEVLAAAPPSPGVYAVSTHLLARAEVWAKVQGVPADWLSRYTAFARAGYSIYLFRHPQRGRALPDRIDRGH